VILARFSLYPLMQLPLRRYMRKTLLAVGSAVLASMMLAPHGGKHGLQGWGPFFSETGFSARDFAYRDIGRVMIDMLALEIVFLAVLFAVLVNMRWRRLRTKNRKPTSNVDSLKSAALGPADASATPSKPRKRRSVTYVLAFTLGVILIVCVVLAIWKSRPAATAGNETNSRENDTADRPFATARGFARYAMKLRERQVDKIPALDEPTILRPRAQNYPWKANIVTTVFWVGEKSYASVWDAKWAENYGGIDNPDPNARRNYIPTGFVPQQNPFYCALPYNDLANGQFKPEAPLLIPWFKQSYTGPGESVCRNRWIAIRKGSRICFAEWEDSGPFRTDDFKYVFGTERPKPNQNHGAGLSVSPAVRDYLGLAQTDVTDWQFVEVRDVPPGPWRSYGENNHFVIARRQLEEQMTKQKSQ
jgi:hypothetical protein